MKSIEIVCPDCNSEEWYIESDGNIRCEKCEECLGHIKKNCYINPRDILFN